jgi:integrase
MTTDVARAILNGILERVGQPTLDNYTVRTWFKEWMSMKASSLSASSQERYRKPLDDFLDYLEGKADRPLRSLTSGEILVFRDEQKGAGRSAKTVNFTHKVITSVLERAKKQGFIQTNPAHAIDYLPLHNERVEKETFMPDEVDRLITAAPSRDWQGVILCGWHGLRLVDCLQLKWGSVDLQNKVLTVYPLKTRRTGGKVIIPMSEELEDFLLTHPMGKPIDPVFPSIASKPVSGKSGASREFADIMETAGLKSGVLRKAAGNAGHDVMARSFHSLRHGTATHLAQAGVDIKTRQMVLGHSTAEQSMHYTHLENKELRVAIDSLPKLKKQWLDSPQQSIK